MIFTSFVSGSGGNCSFLSTGTENILIDCGLSAKKIGENLAAFGLDISDLDAVLLTHEHADHVKGLKRLCSSCQIPVYCSLGTWNGLASVLKDEYFTFAGAECFHCIQPDREFYIGNTLICPFHTYHDTPGPLGFRLELEEEVFGKDINLAVLTDCGKYDTYIQEHLGQLDYLLIEANHDVDLLMRGRYPMFLKRRILSERGHSSNPDTAALLERIWTPRLKEILLAHLSEENNTPEMALDCMKRNFCHPETEVSVAPKDRMAKVIRC